MSDFTFDKHADPEFEGVDDAPPSASAPASRARDEAVPAGSAILRAIRVLEAIAACHAPPQLADICKSVELPKPTVFRILSTLEHAGLVAREPGSKRYHCGPRMNELAGSALLTSPSRSARRGILEELVEQVGETCNLTVASGNSVLCLERVETAWPLKITIAAGSMVPIHSSASGKLFLAHLPRRTRERVVRQLPLVGHTRQTLTDPAVLLEDLERVRQLGYATESEEYLPGICCLAVPVQDGDGRVVAALSIHAPVSRLPIDEATGLLPELNSAAEAMAQTLDW
ncbi:MAG: IclR family transcriptional regulator [Gammaproteobacteria bacterium]